MHQVSVGRAFRVGVFGGAYLDLALARLNAYDVWRRRARDDRLARLVALAKGVDEAHGIMLDKTLEHIAHAVGRLLLVGDNGRAVAYGQHELKPSHVDLHDGGAAPLTGF